MFRKLLAYVLSYFGIQLEPQIVSTVEPQVESMVHTSLTNNTPPITENRSLDQQERKEKEERIAQQARDSIIADAFYSQALDQRKDVDSKTALDLKKQSELLAAKLPVEIEKLIGRRFLVQYKKKKQVEKRKNAEKRHAERKKDIEELIAKGLLPRLRPSEKIEDIQVHYGFQEGYYYVDVFGARRGHRC